MKVHVCPCGKRTWSSNGVYKCARCHPCTDETHEFVEHLQPPIGKRIHVCARCLHTKDAPKPGAPT